MYILIKLFKFYNFNCIVHEYLNVNLQYLIDYYYFSVVFNFLYMKIYTTSLLVVLLKFPQYLRLKCKIRKRVKLRVRLYCHWSCQSRLKPNGFPWYQLLNTVPGRAAVEQLWLIAVFTISCFYDQLSAWCRCRKSVRYCPYLAQHDPTPRSLYSLQIPNSIIRFTDELGEKRNATKHVNATWRG